MGFIIVYFKGYFFHVRTYLNWDLFHDLISEVSTGCRSPILDKLNDFSLTPRAHVVSQDSVIAVKFYHSGKVGISNANDNN